MYKNIQTPPRLQRRFFSQFLSAGFAAFWVLLVFSASSAQAATVAGAQISNAAAATYLDASGTERTVTSNTVTTIVQQVAGVDVESPLTYNVSPGGEVTFPVSLTNTGNGPDSYSLAFNNLAGTFDFSSIVLYADVNGDGVADNTTPITSTPVLAPGETFNFVATGIVPITATSGQQDQIQIIGTSNFNNGVTDNVTDTAIVTNNAVMVVNKAMSATTGASPSGPYTVTLSYTNTGNTNATAVTVTDALPAGMTYAAGTGLWSVTGATALTDGTGDTQGTDPTIDYSVTGNTVTAIISSVAPGQTGTVSFQVNIASNISPSTLPNTATYAYNDGVANIPAVNTNTVLFTVTATANLTFLGDIVTDVPQGSVVSFDNVLTNTGSATDTFDITIANNAFPPGSSYVLYQSGGLVPLLDTNGNGIPDTGPVPSGLPPVSQYTVVLKVTLPPDAVGGGPYTIDKVATSTNNPGVSATATDTLTTITATSVDLTNNGDISTGTGVGAGPEGTAVTTNTVLPGATTPFSLFVNNTSTVADSYDLAASQTTTFPGTLPSGWTVVFRNAATNAVITNTGAIAAGSSLEVIAEVTVPAGQAPIATPGQSIYFQAKSPTTGALDVKHDAVIVSAERSATLIAPNTGQVAPGSTVFYPHTLTNTGNATEDFALTVTSQPGFTSIVYIDTNGDGILDAGDTLVNTTDGLADLTLASGESVKLLIKVTADEGLAIGTIDTTTLTATFTIADIDGIPAPSALTVIDTTTVVDGSITLLKEQALDAGCDGTADGPFSAATITSGAVPGACIIYRITANNSGNSDVTNLVISDNTPAFTTQSTSASYSAGAIALQPGIGNTGLISTSPITLTPSASAILTFGVQID